MIDLNKSFSERIFECNKHKEKILYALSRLKSKMPLTVQDYESISDEDESVIDQMIYRFSKLQDTMGDKLFPSLLTILGENVKPISFVDRLNRLEELELLQAEDWMQLRRSRNEIAHEYSFNHEDVVESINIVYSDCKKLVTLYDAFLLFCEKKSIIS
ncbi:MAG: hypothetical protein PF692_11945 [Kiritimatiellae bacterium]|jgi:uncharacterized protein with HEPN domain|nr:hypothetical protein [Kiritimatiellia bacterium]